MAPSCGSALTYIILAKIFHTSHRVRILSHSGIACSSGIGMRKIINKQKHAEKVVKTKWEKGRIQSPCVSFSRCLSIFRPLY